MQKHIYSISWLVFQACGGRQDGRQLKSAVYETAIPPFHAAGEQAVWQCHRMHCNYGNANVYYCKTVGSPTANQTVYYITAIL